MLWVREHQEAEEDLTLCLWSLGYQSSLPSSFQMWGPTSVGYCDHVSQTEIQLVWDYEEL